MAARRAAEVDDLLLMCHWADLHAADPRRSPDPNRRWCGQDRLVDIGGDGTPSVQELCLPELAVARRTHTLSTRAALADALDLRHRLPRTWAVIQTGQGEPWVARRVASMSRRLDRHQVRIVDDAVADAITGESPGRVLELAQAKVIEADPAGHAERLRAELRRRFVGCGRVDEHGLRMVIARVEAGPAEFLDTVVDQIADALDRHRAHHRDLAPDLPENPTRDELRAEAFGWMAHPERVLDLLTTPDPAPDPAPGRPARQRPRVIAHVHLHEAALHRWGVARVEELGPLLLERLAGLVAGADIELKPVIDLTDRTRVTAYEHPESVKERVHLRTIGDVFPHATRVARNLDLDHPVPYDRDGPDGQTGDHNAAPLGRTDHRAKTHLPYTVRQLGPHDYVWRTPHGLYRHIDATGTHPIDPDEAEELIRDHALQQAIDTIERDLGLTG